MIKKDTYSVLQVFGDSCFYCNKKLNYNFLLFEIDKSFDRNERIVPAARKTRQILKTR